MGRRRPSQRAAHVQAVAPAWARHTAQSRRISCHNTVLCGGGYERGQGWEHEGAALGWPAAWPGRQVDATSA